MKLRVYLFVAIALITFYPVFAQLDKSKYRLVFNGKEIKQEQTDSLKKLYPKVNFRVDTATNPPTLYITPYTDDDSLQTALRMDSLSNSWIGKQIPDFTIKDINGKRIASEDLKGKLVVLNFYFTSCNPCIREMPELNKLVNDYKGKNVVFIAFALDNKTQVTKFLANRSFLYQQVTDAEELTTKTFGIDTWPTHIIVNQTGKVEYFKQGYNGGSILLLKQNIDRLL